MEEYEGERGGSFGAVSGFGGAVGVSGAAGEARGMLKLCIIAGRWE